MASFAENIQRNIRPIDVLAALSALSCLFMAAFFFSESHSKLALAMPLCGVALVIIAWIWYRFQSSTKDFVARRLFPAALIVLSLLFTVCFPPGTVPDEHYHFKASYYYSNMLSHPDDPYAVRTEDAETLAHGWEDNYDGNADHEGVLVKYFNHSSYSRLEQYASPLATNSGDTTCERFTTFVDTFNKEASPIQIKLPSALGMLLAKACGLNCLWLYYLGMLFNMAFGIALIIVAVRLTPIGKNVFMTLALMPMTLHLLGSYSYDVGIIGLSFLLTALILRAIKRESPVGKGEVAAILITACLLAPCKAVYTLIVFLVILIPRERFKSKTHSIVLKAILIAIPFICVLLFRISTLLTMAMQDVNTDVPQNKPSADVDARTHTAKDLLLHPLYTIKILFGTTPIAKGDFYLHSLVGGSLGWFQQNIVAPLYFSGALWLLLILSALSTADDNDTLSRKSRLMCLLIFLVAALGVIASLLLSFTTLSDTVIEGVQGRYFIPVLPLLLLAIRGKAITCNRTVAPSIILALIAMNTTYLGFIVFRL